MTSGQVSVAGFKGRPFRVACRYRDCLSLLNQQGRKHFLVRLLLQLAQRSYNQRRLQGKAASAGGNQQISKSVRLSASLPRRLLCLPKTQSSTTRGRLRGAPMTPPCTLSWWSGTCSLGRGSHHAVWVFFPPAAQGHPHFSCFPA